MSFNKSSILSRAFCLWQCSTRSCGKSNKACSLIASAVPAANESAGARRDFANFFGDPSTDWMFREQLLQTSDRKAGATWGVGANSSSAQIQGSSGVALRRNSCG